VSTSDLINGLFESAGGLFLLSNVCVLYKAKEVKGVSVLTTAFFTAWAIWNCWFYPVNHLWLSFAGGLIIVAANMTWVIMAIYYRKRMIVIINAREYTWFNPVITHTQLAKLAFPSIDPGACTVLYGTRRVQGGLNSNRMVVGDASAIFLTPDLVFNVTASTPGW